MQDQSLEIIRSVATSMLNFGLPMLLDEKHWAQAEKMAQEGLLQRHEPIFKSFGYTLTETGINAYNASLPQSPAPVVPAVKAWGEKPPSTYKKQLAFISAQCDGELENAYWLEVEHEKGTDSWSLCRSELDKKLAELKYDRFGRTDHIHFGFEDSSAALVTCDISGKLADGSRSGDPDAIGYTLSGFAWRREQGFQMELRDWQEARGFVHRLDSGDPEQELLAKLIVQSCFLDPKEVNNTGLLNPGGGGDCLYSELIAYFDFMRKDEEKAADTSLEDHQDRPRG